MDWIEDETLYDFKLIEDIDPLLKNSFEVTYRPQSVQPVPLLDLSDDPKFNTEYILNLLNSLKKIDNKVVKYTGEQNSGIKVWTGTLSGLKVVATRLTVGRVYLFECLLWFLGWNNLFTVLDGIYPFGLVVNAFSDLGKRQDWDSQIESVDLLQKFATNGFIHRTVLKKITSVNNQEDYVEKNVRL